MTPERAAGEALRHVAEYVADTYGPDVVLSALRGILAPHLTPAAVERANEKADELERLKFGAADTDPPR